MAGLTNSGFVPEKLEDITNRIQGKLEAFSPGFDFSPESPDGQLINIMAFEIYSAWSQLDIVYNSYNPNAATGAALRNIGLLTGLPYGAAKRSYANIELQGTSGTLIPKGSQVSDDQGNIFYIVFDTTIPSNAQAMSEVAGAVPVSAGALTTIVTPLVGWTGITQTTDGVLGGKAQTTQQYRNHRQATVARNYTSVVDTMQARLIELGTEQAAIINNDHPIDTLADGTPPNTIHITVGEAGDVSDASIAKVILDTKPLGCPTYLDPTNGVTVAVLDSQGISHDINFSKATEVAIEISMDITYLSLDNAGAETEIRNALISHINSLLAGDDVIWSRLFSLITPYGKAQVNSLTIGRTGGALSAANVVLTDSEHASQVSTDITILVT